MLITKSEKGNNLNPQEQSPGALYKKNIFIYILKMLGKKGFEKKTICIIYLKLNMV